MTDTGAFLLRGQGCPCRQQPLRCCRLSQDSEKTGRRQARWDGHQRVQMQGRQWQAKASSKTSEPMTERSSPIFLATVLQVPSNSCSGLDSVFVICIYGNIHDLQNLVIRIRVGGRYMLCFSLTLGTRRRFLTYVLQKAPARPHAIFNAQFLGLERYDPFYSMPAAGTPVSCH